MNGRVRVGSLCFGRSSGVVFLWQCIDFVFSFYLFFFGFICHGGEGPQTLFVSGLLLLEVRFDSGFVCHDMLLFSCLKMRFEDVQYNIVRKRNILHAY